MVNVLFVCLGNICRSPMAEAVFRHLVNEENLQDKITVDSAGTSNWHIGKRPHEGTLRKLEELTISAEGMYGRQLDVDDLESFDYIIAMDESNLTNTRAMLKNSTDAKIFRFMDLTDRKIDVPDPYYTGDFDETYKLILEASQRLLEKIKQEHQL